MFGGIQPSFATFHTNWVFGWGLMLLAFFAGAVLGLFFYREDFLGGYASFRRRIFRLGHISLAALGMLNVLYGLTPHTVVLPPLHQLASIGLMAGGWTMPAVCFLTAWRAGLRHLFFIPVICLLIGVGAILYGACS